MGPLKHPEIPSPFPPHQWDEVFRKKPSVIRNLQSSVFSLHPVLIPSVWVAKDCLVWALNWKDAASLPSHTPDPSLPFLTIIKNRYTHTHLFTTCWYFNHQHLSVLASTERTIVVVWSLHKWLFCQGFPGVTTDCSRSRAPGGHRRVLGESSGELLEKPSGFLHPPSADFHSYFHFEGGGWRLVLLISSPSYPFPHSAEGLILPSSWAFVSGKKTKPSRETLLREDGKEDFERTGVHWGGVLCQTRAG